MSEKTFTIEDVQRKRADRMGRIDKLAPDIRQLVHEYGFTVVDNFMMLGIVKAKHIRHLVECVLNEFSPTRGSYASQGIRKDATTGIVVKPPVSNT